MAEKLTTEELALLNWNKWERGVAGWSYNSIKSACLAYLAQKAREGVKALWAIRAELIDIRHYFHELDRDGFREAIAEEGRRARNTRRKRESRQRRQVQKRSCPHCLVEPGEPCVTPSGDEREPHVKRARANGVAA